MSRFYSKNFVIALATAVAIFDVFLILVAVPESLPDKFRERSKTIKLDQVDPFKVNFLLFYLFNKIFPFKALCNVSSDPTVRTSVLLYFYHIYQKLAGQYSCFIVHL